MIRTTALTLAAFGAVSHGGIQHTVFDQELRYTLDDLGTEISLAINVDGVDTEDLELRIFNDFETGEFYLAGLDPTRNGGFLTSFDDNDYGVFQTFDFGASIGPENEDSIGFETLTHAAYEYNFFGPELGGGLDESTVYVGFAFRGIVAPDMAALGQEPEMGTLYGWMCLEFGELRYDFGDPDTFIRVKEFAYESTGGSILVGQVPTPSGVALVGVAGLGAARRRR